MTIGKRIQLKRGQKGWSQEKLAEKMMVSKQTVLKWEMDEIIPDSDHILKLSELFKVTTEFLLAGKNQGNNDTAVVRETDAKAKDHRRLLTIGVMSVVAGFLMIGTLLTLSQIIPSKMKSEQYYPAGEIVVLNPDGSEEKTQQGSVQTMYIPVKAFFPFLNTYYLHWVFILGCILLAYGTCSVIYHFKNRHNRRR